MSRKEVVPFVPNEDNLSKDHLHYRDARATLGVGHHELHRRAAAWCKGITAAEADADCDALLADINVGRFNPEQYLMSFVRNVRRDRSGFAISSTPASNTGRQRSMAAIRLATSNMREMRASAGAGS